MPDNKLPSAGGKIVAVNVCKSPESMSLFQRIAHNWRLILACYTQDAAVMLCLTFIYKTLVTEARWAAVLAAWRPWSDRSLFMVSTFLVHELVYIGVHFRSHNVCLHT